jgi:small-conductance mechanosensitive channel
MIALLQEWLQNQIIQKILILIGGILFILIINKIVKKVLTRHIKEKENRYKSRRFLNIFGYLFIVVFLLILFNKDLGGISVALGVAGAGIAFALQEVITSIAGWIAVMFGSFYKIGDRVQLGGIKGDVIDIGILRTTLMEMGQWVDGDLYNGRIVRIANSFVFKEPVFNYSADFPFLWDEIKIQVNYGSDYVLARKIILDTAQSILNSYAKDAEKSWKKIINKYLIESATTAPFISFLMKENWLEYTLRYVVDYKKRRSTKDLLFSTIITGFENTAGKIQFPSSVIQLHKDSTMDVVLRKRNSGDKEEL